MTHAFRSAPDDLEVIQRCIKAAYPSRRDAMKIARNLRKPQGLVDSGKGTIAVYRCKKCGGAWHIGHLNNG